MRVAPNASVLHPKRRWSVSLRSPHCWSFSAIRNNDRVGLILFTDQIELFLPPRKGREHGLRVLREVLTIEPEGRGTQIEQALRYLQQVVTKRAVVFLLSDFQDRGYERILRVASKKHDVIGVTMSDPRELDLPPVGLIQVVDPETGVRGVVDASSRRVRQAYAESAERARQTTRDTLQSCAIDHLELSTDQPTKCRSYASFMNGPVGPLLRDCERCVARFMSESVEC